MESLKVCKLTKAYKNKNEYKNIQNCPLTLIWRNTFGSKAYVRPRQLRSKAIGIQRGFAKELSRLSP